MAIYVEGNEARDVQMELKNTGPEAVTYRVMVVLTPTGTTTPAASSPTTEVTIGGGATETVTTTVVAPATEGLYDSYVLAVYRAPDGTWKPVMADYAFEGVNVYVPGLQVVSVTWV